MALVQERQSDMSGRKIPKGTGARVRVEFYDKKRVALKCDLTDAEVAKLLPFAREVETRPERRRSREDL